MTTHPHDTSGARPVRWRAEQHAEYGTWFCVAPNGDGLGMCFESESEALAVCRILDELDELRSIVSRLPKTADGVPVTPGMELWRIRFGGEVVPHVWNVGMNNSNIAEAFRDLYSTRDAALAAARPLVPEAKR